MLRSLVEHFLCCTASGTAERGYLQPVKSELLHVEPQPRRLLPYCRFRNQCLTQGVRPFRQAQAISTLIAALPLPAARQGETRIAAKVVLGRDTVAADALISSQPTCGSGLTDEGITNQQSGNYVEQGAVATKSQHRCESPPSMLARPRGEAKLGLASAR